jgi:alkylation response protein AidB-like acyl-CoA dehydrogenase
VFDDAAILARVKEIDPIVRQHAAEAERERRLTTAVVDALRWSGVFRMAMPAAWGGPAGPSCHIGFGEWARLRELRGIQPHATVLARANTAARHAGLQPIVGYEVYGKSLLGIEERISLPIGVGHGVTLSAMRPPTLLGVSACMARH